jgi:MFS family permease
VTEGVSLGRQAREGLLGRVALDLAPLRGSPAFRRLWAGQAITFVGWRMTVVAIPFQVYELTGSSLAVGLVALTQFVPLVSFTLVGGTFADVLDRRRLLVVSSLGVLGALGGLAANAALPHPRLWLCFALSFLSWSAFSLGAGAMRAVTPRLVPREQFTAAAALSGLTGNLASVVGPAVAGVLIGTAGLGWAYAAALVGAAAGLWSVLALPSMAPTADGASLTARSLLEGFRYVASQQVILAFFLIDTLAMTFGMPMALFPALADNVFRDASVVGYLFAAPSAGAVVASLLSGWAGRVRRQGIAIVVAVLGWGLAIAAFGVVRTLWPALLLLAVAGAADQISAIFRGTIVLTQTPDRLRGRVSGIEFAQVAGTAALGNVEAGVVAALVSVRFSIVFGGLACVASTLLVALALPALVRFDAARDAARP